MASRRFLLAASVALFAGLAPGRPALARAKTVASSAPAPAFALPATNSGAGADSISLAALRGRAVLVDFWASWCVPCRNSFPWLNELQDQYAKRGLVVVGINLDKDRGAADRFLAANPARFTVAFDPSGRTAETYRVKAMPTTILVGRDGEILATHAGFDPGTTASFETHVKEACEP